MPQSLVSAGQICAIDDDTSCSCKVDEAEYVGL